MNFNEDNLVIYKTFSGDLNNRIIKTILEDGYILADEVENKDIEALLEKGIIKRQKDQLIVNY